MGSWGGSPMEDWMETEIDPREPRSFPQSTLLSVRQNSWKSHWNGQDHVNYVEYKDKTKEKIEVKNWEIYDAEYWYEFRHRDTICPQIPTGIAAACDWALNSKCLFGDTSPNNRPKTIFVHTYMLPHFHESTLRFMNQTDRFVLVTGVRLALALALALIGLFRALAVDSYVILLL